MSDTKTTAKDLAEQSRGIVMKLQLEGKVDRQILSAMALLTNAVLELTKKD